MTALKRQRLLKGLTQADLAEKVGVSQRTISDLECGANRNPSWDTVAKIAAVLEVEPETIFPVADTNPATDDEQAASR